MATKTSLVINAVNNGKALQKTLTDINPAADNTALRTWGQMLNNLTTNTYVKTDRIDKTNCDSVSAKLTPSVKIANNVENIPYSSAIGGQGYALDVVGDGNFSIVKSDDSAWTTGIRRGSSGAWRLLIGKPIDGTADFMTVPHDIIIRTEETDTYKAGEFVIQIVADA